VEDSSVRSRVCQRCITQGSVESWVLGLGEVRPVPHAALRSALSDEDWRIRWAAVRAGAKTRGVSDVQALAEWVASTPASADLPACLTAARAAAERERPASAFLKGGGDKGFTAAARVQARKEDIRKALELELYAQDPGSRERALAHLAVFLNLPAARVAIDALEGRPESADASVASALKAYAERKETSVGRMLLEAARPGDQERVNRLFAVYSQELQALQPDLLSADPMKRRTTVYSLRIYGPLAQRELEKAMQDPDGQVRQNAARGLARASGFSLREAAVRQLHSGAELATLRPWLETLAHDKDCQAQLLAVAEDARLAAPIRGEALAQLMECSWSNDRYKRVAPFLRDGQPPIRAGAVRALGLGGSTAELSEALTAALEDPSPEVVAAAIDTAAHRRQSAYADHIAKLLVAEHPMVRQAAARALERLGRPRHVKELSDCLQQDPAPAVRVSAAQTLGVLGGPLALSALSQAAQRDPDTHVQHVSREALKRLGFSKR
jgi:HEAT repeat protein